MDNKKKRQLTLIAVALASIVFGLALASRFDLMGSPAASNTVNPQALPASFASLVKAVSPAVVNISAVRTIKGGGRVFRHFMGPSDKNDPFRDFFEKFFGDQSPERDLKQRSLGSGIIIDKDGYIITNNHVIEHADQIKVRLADEREFSAEIIGRDPKTDLALIKIDSFRDLPSVTLGDSDALSIGDWVITIGNPFGLNHTVTAGIVSAKGRIIGAGPYDDFIQTDASINPGNSGGPLLNVKGEVVGINTAIVATGQGIGFAIPINIAKEIIVQLKEKRRVVRGWLGVAIQKMTPELARSFGIKEGRGALVGDVFAGSPAEKSNIKRGDVIIEFDGKKIDEMSDLPRLVANTPVGKTVLIKIIRDGQEQGLTAKISEMKEEKPPVAKTEVERKIGLSVQEITPEIAEELGLEDETGVIVTGVAPGSPAEDADFNQGDIIKEINRKSIKNLKDYRMAMDKAAKEDAILFLVQREGQTLYLSITPGE
ncbi:MAG: DegQ family serine endoprotease [Thermodesulfobacteriota bacterium]|nr:DegQ family serine endoprotease [Desulfovibrionales bacterium]MDQ7837863.1 DegQ family serine endoprotease [Thermodesulfobacteriota bacterium]